MEPISTTIILALALWLTYRYHCQTSPAYDTPTARRIHAFNLSMAGIAIVVVFVVVLKWTPLVTAAALFQLGVLTGRWFRTSREAARGLWQRLKYLWNNSNAP